MEQILARIKAAIVKYRENQYTEEDFQSTLNSVIDFITEDDLFALRNFLMKSDSDLECINFMVNKKNQRDEYLKVLNNIEVYIANFVTH